MSSTRLRQFDRQLKRRVAPWLADEGFRWDGRRTFTRDVSHRQICSVQIVEFQVGTSFMAGRFTVNLAVFNSEYRPRDWEAPENPPAPYDCLPQLKERLGRMRRRGLFARLFGMTWPIDYWWKQSSDEALMQERFGEVLELLRLRGLPWLEQHSRREVLAAALADLEEARARRLRLAQPHP